MDFVAHMCFVRVARGNDLMVSKSGSSHTHCKSSGAHVNS